MRKPFVPLAVSAYTATSALGHGLHAHATAIATQRSGLRRNDFGTPPLPCWIGRVDGVEHASLPPPFAQWDCRNNRLAWLGLNQDDFLMQVARARSRYGAARIAVLLGTSTASIGATEEAYRRLDSHGQFAADLQRPAIHTPHSLSAFVAAALELTGPCLTISTACSSSAKVFASAERLIRLGLVDAAVVGGVDSLCDSILHGFNALELISQQPCRPFDAHRDGISIGEAAAFALLERPCKESTDAPRLLACGESSDAYHMSSPDPDGAGAELALQAALTCAEIDAGDIDYVNLHGTASVKNDQVEAELVARTLSSRTRVSSTKALTGHTLGAAGALEVVLTLLAMRDGVIPGNGIGVPDPLCGAPFAWHNEVRDIHIAMSHSFGFGGNNTCVVLAKASAL